MNAKELRIGNYFNEKHSSELIQVYELLRDGTIVFDFECNGVWQAEPIKLNEYWLLKLGVEKHESFKHCFIKDKLLFEYLFQDVNLTVRLRLNGFESIPICDVKYIHELQNIYFCLTGHELTVA